jgi:hypothetical protein
MTQVVGFLALIPPVEPAVCDKDVVMIVNLWLCEPSQD